MTRLFRSKSCSLVVGRTDFIPPSSLPPAAAAAPFFQDVENDDDDDEEEDEDDGEEFESDDDYDSSNPVSTPFINPAAAAKSEFRNQSQNQFTILDFVLAALKKSLVTCSVEREDVSSSLDIGWPTEVRHVSHVTFDRFNGFLGLPTELEPEIPRKVPSASVSVFGVSAKSMQCSYDDRGNSVPTILLMMQKRLYSEGGLKAEGIFRINAENSQEESLRDQLNRGVVPRGIDVHCLSGLIKAWFRELPTGVLDSLTPEQVMRCNTEEDCTKLAELLPPTEAALLDWAINLMADVVEHEQFNKMNARNIAMVFAPNMTQMADPLTALIHAVQVMNFLKNLILKVLREREKSVTNTRMLSSYLESPSCKDHPTPDFNIDEAHKHTKDEKNATKPPAENKIPMPSTMEKMDLSVNEKLRTSEEKGNNADDRECVPVSGGNSPSRRYDVSSVENGDRSKYDSEHWLRLRKGVLKLCRHPVFQLSKPSKKPASVGIVNTRGRGGEAWG